MKSNTLLTLLSAHMKAATVAVVAVGATAGGGLAIATTVANSNGTPGVNANAQPTDSPDETQSPDANETHSPDSNASSSAVVTNVVAPTDCPTGLSNHGGYVSSIAKTRPTPGSSPGAHGAAVSAAAQSDCGKPSPNASESESGGPTGQPSHPAHPSHPAQPSSQSSHATSHPSNQSSHAAGHGNH